MHGLAQRTKFLFNTILIIPLMRLHTDRLFCIMMSEPSQPNMSTDCDVKTVTMTTGTAANGIWYHNLVIVETSNHGTMCSTHQMLDWLPNFKIWENSIKLSFQKFLILIWLRAGFCNCCAVCFLRNMNWIFMEYFLCTFYDQMFCTCIHIDLTYCIHVWDSVRVLSPRA